MKRALVLGRQRKGRDVERVVREVRITLRRGGWRVDAKVVKRKRALERQAARAVRAGCDVVVAVGGDGAVGRVASALAETQVALGIIPTGTGNLLAANLKIPRGTGKAARTLLTGRTRQIDLGRATVDGADQDFTVACGVGFDAEVLDATSSQQKLRWGKLAYLANAVGQTGTIENVPHEITIDGAITRTDAAQVFIANFGKMLPVVEPRPPIRPTDGQLDVVVVRASGPLPGLLATWEAMRQTDLGESSGGHIFRARGREVRIETSPSRLVEIDGTVIGRTPVVATIRPAALNVIVPKK
jgi:diacylglycerol kinase (ATP)